jgi:RNA polymerase sigma-70 factor (ECF subfamily)
MDDATRRARFEAVFDEVYEPLQRYLRRRCPTAEVDDVLSEVLTTLWRRLDDVPAGAALPWSYGVARRTLANHRRGAGRRLRLAHRLAARAEDAPANAWTSAADVVLAGALERLGELDREVLRLWAWEQLEPREIAVALGSTPGAVSTRLGRVRDRLRSELAREDPAVAGQGAVEDHSELER